MSRRCPPPAGTPFGVRPRAPPLAPPASGISLLLGRAERSRASRCRGRESGPFPERCRAVGQILLEAELDLASWRCPSSLVARQQCVIAPSEQPAAGACNPRQLGASLGHRVDRLARRSHADRHLACRQKRRPSIRNHRGAILRAERPAAPSSALRRTAQLRLACRPAIFLLLSNISLVHAGLISQARCRTASEPSSRAALRNGRRNQCQARSRTGRWSLINDQG